MEKYFLLSWKKTLIIIALEFASAILHNLVSGFLGSEEVPFFILTVFLLPSYFLAAASYTLIAKVKK